MGNIAIKAENLGKAYQLGEIGTGTISRDLERWFARVRGKEDPFLRIGETNDRSRKGTSDVVWSLKDISFEIEQGDAVGIIGRNGAGKSTLLKIISRITSPTTGKIQGKGRIASLLEVGTGFHPELTGRENIFLNGAILGMRKREIARKFDEIVDFAGVERYVDTPVKRYSSGMYVRLAFAVAAHLESEILIVDEVLAVGDAEFQKKCLGKMGEVSKGEGRTVLFVSHSMSSVLGLCENCILMNNGEVEHSGPAAGAISRYLSKNASIGSSRVWKTMAEAPGNTTVRLLGVSAINKDRQPKHLFTNDEQIGIQLDYSVLQKDFVLWHGLNFYDEAGHNLFDSHSTDLRWYTTPHPEGTFTTTAWIPEYLFNTGRITVNVAIFNHKTNHLHLYEKDVIAFEISETQTRGYSSDGKFPGLLRPKLIWE